MIQEILYRPGIYYSWLARDYNIIYNVGDSPMEERLRLDGDDLGFNPGGDMYLCHNV